MRLDAGALPKVIKTSIPEGTKLEPADNGGLGMNRIRSRDPGNIQINNNGIKMDGHSLPGFPSKGYSESHQTEVLKAQSTTGSREMNIQGANPNLGQVDVHLKGNDKLNIGVGNIAQDSETTIHAKGKNDVTINPKEGNWSLYKISDSKDDNIKISGQDSPIEPAESGNTGIYIDPTGKSEVFDLNKQDFNSESGKVEDLEDWQIEDRKDNPPVRDSDNTLAI